MPADYEGSVVTLFNTDVKIRMLKHRVIQLEEQIKTLTSQLTEETQRADDLREEVRKLRGRVMCNTKLSNAAIKRRQQAQDKKAQRQAETQLSPSEGMAGTSGSESISA